MEKIDNQLNMALQLSAEERIKSFGLDTGFNSEEGTWQLIVRHDGTITDVLNGQRNAGVQDNESLEWERLIREGVSGILLNNNYAILSVPENLINEVASLESVIFVEKSNALYPQIINGKRASCISVLQNRNNSDSLYGKNILLGIIDTGIDGNNDAFKNADGTSKIIGYWDQNKIGDNAFDAASAVDISGHGTSVASIATSIASDSEIIVVRLATQTKNGFPGTAQLMSAVDYVVNEAKRLRRPVAINISFGNNYGSHDGLSLVETFMNDISNTWKNVIVVGTGNEGVGRNHFQTNIKNLETEIAEFVIGDFVSAINLQIWKYYQDNFSIVIEGPNGERRVIPEETNRTSGFLIGNTNVLVYYGTPKPYTTGQEIYFEFIPDGDYVDTGIWKVELFGISIAAGRVDMWLPGTAAIGDNTGFLLPSPDTTMTIPSTAEKVISVGAYDGFAGNYAPFSGRGFTRVFNVVKPDIVAPGVNIRTAAAGGGTRLVSGTSFAAPFVTGAAALLMEWGVERGNDPYLYGEKVKAYLIKGARQLSGMETPNPMTGWGALCLSESK